VLSISGSKSSTLLDPASDVRRNLVVVMRILRRPVPLNNPPVHSKKPTT
jgi:hypothetical protein